MSKKQLFSCLQSIASNSRRSGQESRNRRLPLEQLEPRQLLSVSPCLTVGETDVQYVASGEDSSLPAALTATEKVQKVSSTTPLITAQPGEIFTVPVMYKALDGQGNLTGLALRIHYDSSKLTYNSVESLLKTSRVGTIQDKEDAKNYDGDSSTDRILVVSWMDQDGMWPGCAEQLLMNLKFIVNDGAYGTSTIRFTYGSKAVGYSFESEPVTVTIQSSGYDATEYALLRDFLETESVGVKNGQRLGLNYSAEDPSTWGGITWCMESDGVKHATKICWKDAGLAGSVALASLEKLTHFDSTGNDSLEIKSLPKNVKSASESTFQSVITLDASENMDEETVSENTAILNEWSSFEVELWSDFAAEKECEIKWDSSVFTLDFEKTRKRAGVLVESRGTATVDEGGLTTQTFVVTAETGYTANAGETLVAAFKFTPVTKQGALAVGEALNSAIKVNGEQIATKVYSVCYDLNEQGNVDINDLVIFAKFFGSTNGNSWKADFNGDGKVDTNDLVLFARNFGLSPSTANRVRYSENYKPRTTVPVLTDQAWTDLWSELEDEEEERANLFAKRRT